MTRFTNNTSTRIPPKVKQAQDFSRLVDSVPNFMPEIKELLLDEATSGFNWSGISPTIFGAVFESTLNPETRRAGGMHYTSLENIHKVINALLLNELREESGRKFASANQHVKKFLL